MNAIDFQDEAAVKEYIDRIGIEFRFQCFSEDRSDGCHRLGDWLEFAKKDWAGAGRIFKLNCDCHQYGHSCFKYGVYNFLGRGLKEVNREEAAKYYKEGCYSPNEPHAPACVNLGLMVKDGVHAVAEPEAEARKHFERGCDLGDGDSCGNAIISCLTEGFKDVTRAFLFAKRGCDLNDFRSCRVLSDMYQRGEGCDEPNPLLAEEALEKADKIKKEAKEERPNVTFGR